MLVTSRSFLAAAIALLSLAGIGPVHAQTAPILNLPDIPKIAVGIQAGTYGIGPVVNLHTPGSIWGARADLAFFRYGQDFDAYGQKFNGSLTLLSGGVTADLYPFRSGFRASVGLRGNNNHADFNTANQGTLKIGNNTYGSNDITGASGSVRYSAVAPYLGVGYEHQLGNFVLGGDLGAMFQGSGTATVTGTGLVSGSPAFEADREMVRQKLRREANRLSVYPVVMLSVSYRF